MRRLGAALGLAFALAVALGQTANADGIDRTFPLAGQPRTVLIDPTDGRIFVANTADPRGFMSAIEPISGQVTNYATSGTPNVMAIDSLHRRLYVANYNQTLDVFDLTNNALMATLPVYGLGLAVDMTTQRVYATGATYLTVIDGTTNTVLTTRPALDHEDWYAVAVDPSLHRVYITNFFTWPEFNVYPSLIALDDRDLSIITEVRVPQTRWGLVVDQQRHRVYVAGISNVGTSYVPQLVAYDGLSLAQIGSAPVPGDPAGVALGPELIYVTSTALGYSVVDANTFAVRQSFSTLPMRPFLPALDAAGTLYLGALGDPSGPNALVSISGGNHPPIFARATILPAVPTTLDVLQFSVPAIDGDFAVYPGGQRDPVSSAYDWARNGSPIAGETTSTLDLSRAGAGDRADTITAHVVFTDPQGLTTSASASVVVANALPTVTVSLSSTSPHENDVLIASASASDIDGDTVTLTYEWLRNGVVIPGASGTSLDLAAQDRPINSITVRVTASDGHGGLSVAARTALVLPSRGSFLYVNSQPGDFIGGGLEQLYVSPSPPIQGSLPQGGDTFRADVFSASWGVVMSAPRGSPLAVGSYIGAVRSAFRPAGSPGLDVSGNNHGCNTLTGNFTVTQIAYSQYNELMLFDATFEQHCEGAVPALFGHIHIDAPPPTPGVTLPTGSTAVPTSGSFLYMNSQGEYIGQGREWLYTSFDSAVYGALPLGGQQFNASIVQGNYVHWWDVNIAAPQGQALALGSYIRAVRAPGPPGGLPGLSVGGDGRGCNTINGKFDVDELSYSPRGDLLVFQATFEQHCESGPLALFGRVRIENPTSSPGVALPSGSIAVPTSGTFLYLNSAPAEYVGGGVEQLYTSGNSTMTFSLADTIDYFRSSTAQGSHLWSVEIASPPTQPLAVGSYVGARRAGVVSGGIPGLEIKGEGRSCADITGKFDVNELSFWANGELKAFQATFEQHCLGRALFGRIRVEVVAPIQIAAALKQDGSVTKSGAAKIAGVVACSRSAAVDLVVTLTQVQSKRVTITGTVTVQINCTAPFVAWSQVVSPDSGAFKEGSVSASFNATACETGRRCVSAPGTWTVKLTK